MDRDRVVQKGPDGSYSSGDGSLGGSSGSGVAAPAEGYRTLKANARMVEQNPCAHCAGGFSLAENVVQCASCDGLYHQRCWEETGGCVRESCQVGLRACPSCGKLVKDTALKCRYCGAYTDVRAKQDFDPINPELRDYVVSPGGISRVGLNVMCGIGVFIFGWLLAVAFGSLKKSGTGWAYVIPIILFAVIGRSGEPVCSLLALVLYIIGWVHANAVLSGYQRAARARLLALEGREGVDVDAALEKGLLLHKVIEDRPAGLSALCAAVPLAGGDPALLSRAGAILSAGQRYQEAMSLLERARAGTHDNALLKQINQTMTAMEKKLGVSR